MAKYALFLPVFFVVFFLQIKDTSAQNKNLFTLIPASDSGITFSNDIIDEKEKNILLYANFYGGAGVGVGDFNNDGKLDILIAGHGMFGSNLLACLQWDVPYAENPKAWLSFAGAFVPNPARLLPIWTPRWLLSAVPHAPETG